jgi:hypothetical protein
MSGEKNHHVVWFSRSALRATTSMGASLCALRRLATQWNEIRTRQIPTSRRVYLLI